MSRLPLPPQVFFGRSGEVQQIVDTVTGSTASCIAALGPPGIGKTSLALSVLHDPSIVMKFRERRYFVQCDGVHNTVAFIHRTALALGIEPGAPAHTRNAIKAVLSSDAGFVVLDNFESPWESTETRAAVELFLAALAKIPVLHMLVTMRGAERPYGVAWHRPFLQPLEPLDRESSMQIFAAIADPGDDEQSFRMLMDELGDVPLAVTLIGNLAQVESPTSLLTRWRTSGTTMLQHDASNPRSSIDGSIAMSIESPRMVAEPRALKLLTILAHLPDGIAQADLMNAAPHLGAPMSVLATLLQCSLARKAPDGHITLLPPIRAYIQQHHQIDHDSVSHLLNYIFGLVRAWNRLSAQLPAGNVNEVMDLALSNSPDTAAVIYAVTRWYQICSATMPLPKDILTRAKSLALQHGDKRLVAVCQTCDYHPDSKVLRSGLLEALATFQELGDKRYQVQVLSRLANINGPIPKLYYAQQAVLIADTIGESNQQIQCLARLGMHERLRGNFGAARVALQRAVDLDCAGAFPMARRELEHLDVSAGNLEAALKSVQTALGMPVGIWSVDRAGCHTTIAEISGLKGDHASAITHLRTAVELFERCGQERYRVYYLAPMVTAYLEQTEIDVPTAASTVEKMRELLVQIDSSWTEGWSLYKRCLGELEMAHGGWQAAAQHMMSAIQADSDSVKDHCAYELGRALLGMNDPLGACTAIILAAARYRREPQVCLVCSALNLLVEAFLRRSEFSTARTIALAIIPWFRKAGMRRELASCLLRLARGYGAQRDEDSAIAASAEALHHYQALSHRRGVEECRMFAAAL